MRFRKRVMEAIFFLGMMGLTFWIIFHGQKPGVLLLELRDMKAGALVGSVVLALFFVAAEGSMIYILLHAMEGTSSLWRCIQYSYIGFFYSGITPSATGGQPMQLYYMKKDGNELSKSSIVLMTVALLYKLVLVLVGLGLLIFSYSFLQERLGRYLMLYFLGLFLNILLVVLILGAMFCPGVLYGIYSRVESGLIRLRLLKESESRTAKVRQFFEEYHEAVNWLKEHPAHVLLVTGLTFIQRSSLFVLTYLVYLGFGLSGVPAWEVIVLQASVYIAVDMLPLPGAQGITEWMYRSVFQGIFTGGYLVPSMLVSRGINFYFLLLISMGFAVSQIGQRSGKKVLDTKEKNIV